MRSSSSSLSCQPSHGFFLVNPAVFCRETARWTGFRLALSVVRRPHWERYDRLSLSVLVGLAPVGVGLPNALLRLSGLRGLACAHKNVLALLAGYLLSRRPAGAPLRPRLLGDNFRFWHRPTATRRGSALFLLPVLALLAGHLMTIGVASRGGCLVKVLALLAWHLLLGLSLSTGAPRGTWPLGSNLRCGSSSIYEMLRIALHSFCTRPPTKAVAGPSPCTSGGV